MLLRLRQVFERCVQGTLMPAGSPDDKHLAAAALMLEVAVADHEFDPQELARLQRVLEDKFAISEEDSSEYLQLAQQTQLENTSLHPLTRLINTHYNADEKYQLLVGLWEIAYADGDLHKYEEAVIRRLSDLLYLSHSEFIRAKLSARQSTR